MTTSCNSLELFSVTDFNHTNIPFIDYEDIIGDFQNKKIEHFYGFHADEIWVARLNKERVGFVGSIGFFSTQGKFKVFVFEDFLSDPVVTVEWESISNMRGNRTYYAMKIKMDTLLETDAWPYMIKFIDSARAWWHPLFPLVSKIEEFN
jgi:hypothetical protein